jgi:hypothetical protein
MTVGVVVGTGISVRKVLVVVDAAEKLVAVGGTLVAAGVADVGGTLGAVGGLMIAG